MCVTGRKARRTNDGGGEGGGERVNSEERKTDRRGGGGAKVNTERGEKDPKRNGGERVETKTQNEKLRVGGGGGGKNVVLTVYGISGQGEAERWLGR